MKILSEQNSYEKQQKKIRGGIKINTIILCFIPFILISPWIAYSMAIKKGEQHKFPHPTITDTACHYPQDIQFRLVMGGSGSFLSLIYFVLFKWTSSIKKRIDYPHTTYNYLHYICQASVWGFQIAMGTIDGNGYPDLHTDSAVFFFLMLFILVLTKTIVIRDMYRWDTSFISTRDLWLKMLLGVYVALVWAFTLTGLVLNPQEANDDQNPYIVILQYNSVYVCLFWVVSFMPDWKDIHVTLSEYSNQVDLTAQ